MCVASPYFFLKSFDQIFVLQNHISIYYTAYSQTIKRLRKTQTYFKFFVWRRVWTAQLCTFLVHSISILYSSTFFWLRFSCSFSPICSYLYLLILYTFDSINSHTWITYIFENRLHSMCIESSISSKCKQNIEAKKNDDAWNGRKDKWESGMMSESIKMRDRYIVIQQQREEENQKGSIIVILARYIAKTLFIIFALLVQQ